ncbi:MAG: hypothetical protein IH936_09830 [Acidobacteria bacterium]|nr:hypothetical protein [Acidobacteriota bacterium]
MEKHNALLEKIVRRLDVLIALAAEEPAPSEAVKTAEKIKRLSALGLTAGEVSTVINKPSNYVTATLSRQRKTARKGSA